MLSLFQRCRTNPHHKELTLSKGVGQPPYKLDSCAHVKKQANSSSFQALNTPGYYQRIKILVFVVKQIFSLSNQIFSMLLESAVTKKKHSRKLMCLVCSKKD